MNSKEKPSSCLIICKKGYETRLENEITAQGGVITDTAESRICAKIERSMIENLCFASVTLLEPLYIKPEGSLVNTLSTAFCTMYRSVRVDYPWPLAIISLDHEGAPQLRLEIYNKCIARIKKAMSRVAGLSYPATLYPSRWASGFGVIIGPDEKFFASQEFFFGGQHRVNADSSAPSRSYGKIEEAFGILGCAPKSGETVVDIGAAPGGWSYSAAKRGAHVIAVDNGPLKRGALNNPKIQHLRADGFSYRPDRPVDWIFCDMVEDPMRILKLLARWISLGLAPIFIVNLKIGRTQGAFVAIEAKKLLHRKVKGKKLILRHLYHDRDEITVMIA